MPALVHRWRRSDRRDEPRFRQPARSHARGAELAEPRFRTPLFYGAVRHPIYAGFIMAFWATPVMTWGHLLLAAGMTVYVVIAIRHEERDLVGLYGETYVQYRARVGMLVPRFMRVR
jgi:methanethiol S-methyltransferase